METVQFEFDIYINQILVWISNTCIKRANLRQSLIDQLN